MIFMPLISLMLVLVPSFMVHLYGGLIMTLEEDNSNDFSFYLTSMMVIDEVDKQFHGVHISLTMFQRTLGFLMMC